MRKLICSAVVAVAMSSASFAQVTSIESANPAPKSSSKWDPNKIVCQQYETTGTRLGRRTVCKTALEWRELTAAQRHDVEELQRMGTSVGCQEGQSCVQLGPLGQTPH